MPQAGDGVIAAERRSCQAAASVERWHLPPASSALPGSTGCTREQPGSFLPFFLFSPPFSSPFFSVPVQHEQSRDPSGGFAAIRRRWLVLCQILRWGKAGRNLFCNVSAGAVGESRARCCSPWPGLSLGLSSLEQSEHGSDLPDLCSLPALLQIWFLFTLKSLLLSQPAPPGQDLTLHRALKPFLGNAFPRAPVQPRREQFAFLAVSCQPEPPGVLLMSRLRKVPVDARVNLENKRLHTAFTKYRTSVCCGAGRLQTAHGEVMLLN